MQLSEAIRKGAAMTGPLKGKFKYIHDGCSCAVGAALVGYAGSWEKGLNLRDGGTQATVARIFGRTEEEISALSVMFELRGFTREQVADFVERHYESKARESDSDFATRKVREIVEGAGQMVGAK